MRKNVEFFMGAVVLVFVEPTGLKVMSRIINRKECYPTKLLQRGVFFLEADF